MHNRNCLTNDANAGLNVAPVASDKSSGPVRRTCRNQRNTSAWDLSYPERLVRITAYSHQNDGVCAMRFHSLRPCAAAAG